MSTTLVPVDGTTRNLYQTSFRNEREPPVGFLLYLLVPGCLLISWWFGWRLEQSRDFHQEIRPSFVLCRRSLELYFVTAERTSAPAFALCTRTLPFPWYGVHEPLYPQCVTRTAEALMSQPLNLHSVTRTFPGVETINQDEEAPRMPFVTTCLSAWAVTWL